MSLSAKDSRTIRRGLPALVLVAALGLSGCGGGEEDSSASDGNDTTEEFADDVAGNEPSDSEGAGEPGDADAPDPAAILPNETDVPEGFAMVPANCEPGGPNDPEASKDKRDDADAGTKYSAWITYAVPEGWESAGRGSAGSGGVTGTDEDLTFRTGESDRTKLRITVAWDSKNVDGTITDSSGEPWESFDYDSSIGDEATTITYDNVATVQVGDQQAELFYLDPAQAPDFVSQTQYKVRLEAFEMPRRTADGTYELMAESFVVTFEFDEEDAPIDQETIESIVGSFVLPECSSDAALEEAELMLNLDLNGDGHVRNAEDLQADLQEMQEELEAKLKEEREG